MLTGKMRRMVTIRTNARAPDGMGGYTETPADIDNIPARIQPLEGNEKLRAMQTGMTAPHQFTLRYRSDIRGASTLVYDGRTFDIQSIVDPEEKHRELVILADEVEAT